MADPEPPKVIFADAGSDGHDYRILVERCDDNGFWRPTSYPVYLPTHAALILVPNGATPGVPVWILSEIHERTERRGIIGKTIVRLAAIESVHATEESAKTRLWKLQRSTGGDWRIESFRIITESPEAVP